MLLHLFGSVGETTRVCMVGICFGRVQFCGLSVFYLTTWKIKEDILLSPCDTKMERVAIFEKLDHLEQNINDHNLYSILKVLDEIRSWVAPLLDEYGNLSFSYRKFILRLTRIFEYIRSERVSDCMNFTEVGYYYSSYITFMRNIWKMAYSIKEYYFTNLYRKVKDLGRVIHIIIFRLQSLYFSLVPEEEHGDLFIDIDVIMRVASDVTSIYNFPFNSLVHTKGDLKPLEKNGRRVCYVSSNL